MAIIARRGYNKKLVLDESKFTRSIIFLVSENGRNVVKHVVMHAPTSLGFMRSASDSVTLHI